MKAENILISGSSPAKYRVAEGLIRRRIEEGQPVILIDFERRFSLLPEAGEAELASFLGYLSPKELNQVYQEMAQALDLNVNGAAMNRFLSFLGAFYRNHNEVLTIEELRTLDISKLREQVRLAGDVPFFRFLESHEIALEEVENVVVCISETLAGSSEGPFDGEADWRISVPLDEESPEARAFLKLLPFLLERILRERQGAGTLCVIQGTPYNASALIARLTAIPEADWLVVSGDIFGVMTEYQSEILGRMGKCLVYSHPLETSAAKWSAKIGIHTVRRASVSQSPPRGFLGKTKSRFMTPRNSGLTGTFAADAGGCMVTPEEKPCIRPDEIVRLRPDECICIDQITGQYNRM